MYKVTKIALTGNEADDLNTIKDFLGEKGYLANAHPGGYILVTRNLVLQGSFRYHPETSSISFNFEDPGRKNGFEEEMETLLA